MSTSVIGRVQSPRLIRIGGGVAKEVAEVLTQLGLNRPLIVTDTNLVALGHVAVVSTALDAADIGWEIFDGVVEDPTDTCVKAGLAALGSGDFDCIIGVGGGSPMDTAKAISFMSVNPGHVRDYKAPCQIDRPGPPRHSDTDNGRHRVRIDPLVRDH